jgi:DNA-binding NarL/FixJ family response regulator
MQVELTTPERDLVSMIASGQGTPQIAKNLGQDEQQVNERISELLHKLQLHHRIEIVFWAYAEARVAEITEAV